MIQQYLVEGSSVREPMTGCRFGHDGEKLCVVRKQGRGFYPLDPFRHVSREGGYPPTPPNPLRHVIDHEVTGYKRKPSDGSRAFEVNTMAGVEQTFEPVVKKPKRSEVHEDVIVPVVKIRNREPFTYFDVLDQNEVPSGDHWNVLAPLPLEIEETILNLAGRRRAQERLALGWAEIHHAFKPCSVCDKLLNMEVDDAGQIISVGKRTNFFQNIDWWLTKNPRGGRVHGRAECLLIR